MNYYAQGGQAHGLKALAQELPQYGRYGDSIVAHINPQEAGILKALGGSGTINPHTGLPEFFSIGSVFKPVQRAIGQLNPLNPGSAVSKAVDSIPIVGEANRAINNLGTQIFQPLEKAIVQPASAGLASFDKMVGKAIPGGWGTVAQVAASMIPGGQPLAIGLGALNGSGVMHKGGKFNLQGAMIGGATAYATSELGEYLRAAGGAPDAALLPVSEGAVPVSATAAELTADEIAKNSANEMTRALASESANVLKEVPQPYSMTENLLKGNFSDAASQLGTKFTEGASQLGTDMANAPGNAYEAVKNYNYSGAVDNATKGMGDTVSGIKSVLTGNIDPAAAAAVKSGATMAPMMATAGTVYGVTSLAAMDEQRKYLEEAKQANAISQAEYDKAMAEINRSTEDARKAVRESPFSANPNRDVSIGDTFYGRGKESENLYSRMTGDSTLYAVGGSVDDEYGIDEARGLSQGNLQNGLFGGGIAGYAAGGHLGGYSDGGQFLNGPGDGMSDSIPASIEGKQPARLANEEFVVPADVVSHLGNGSSKAGAKQLYSMMDKVRKARTGTEKQGKQINPRKYLAA